MKHQGTWEWGLLTALLAIPSLGWIESAKDGEFCSLASRVLMSLIAVFGVALRSLILKKLLSVQWKQGGHRRALLPSQRALRGPR